MAIKQAVSRLGRGIDGLKTQGAGATCIWIGGGADNLWTNALNWDQLPVAGDNLVFDGTTRLTPSNDFAAATSFNSITFARGAGAFTLSTNQITLTGDILNQSSNDQIIALAVDFTTVITINTEAQSIYLTGVWSGTGGGWTKLGTGTLYVKAACTATGAVTISEGTQNHGDGGATGNVGAVTSFVNNGALVYQRTNATSSAYSISGTGTVTNNGTAGQINTLSGTNTYTGATIVSSGTLAAGSTQAFGVNSAVTMDAVASNLLDITGFSNSIGSITGGSGSVGNVTLGSATLTLGGDNTSPTYYSGKFTGTGNVTKVGSGTFKTNSAQQLSGVITISAGTFQLGSGSTGGTLASVSSMVNNADFLVNKSNAVTLGFVISGSGNVTKSGSGTLTLSGTNTYTGATTINAGTLLVTGSLASGSAVSVVGGSLTGPTTTGASATVAGTIAVTSAAAAIVQPGAFGNNVLNTGALTFSGTLAAFIANSTTTTFSTVAVTGNVALGAMDITVPAGITTNGTYKIITATGTMSGTLPTVVSNSTGKTLVVQQTGNDLELVVS